MKQPNRTVRFHEYANESIDHATDLVGLGLLPKLAVFGYLTEENVLNRAKNIDDEIA